MTVTLYNHVILDQTGKIPSSLLPHGSPESDEDRVVRMLKGDFEIIMGMSYERFIEIHKYLIEHHPEKLI